MATNPMQRKTRNSFLLGVLITLILAALVIGLLLVQLKNYKDKEAKERESSVKIWVLDENVISGQIITTDMLKTQILSKSIVPSNAIGDMSILENYALTDKEGNEVITEYKNNVATLYLNKNNTKYEIKTEEETGSYYIEDSNKQKQYIDLAQDPIVAKINMNRNSVITIDMITKSEEETTNDLRKQEYNMFVLPSQLESGEYIDIRLSLPSGQDYIVVSKKQVEIPEINGSESEDTILLKLKEDEIITLNNAIVDAYRMMGSMLYVSRYVEAGIQDAATPTYIPKGEVMQLIISDPNIIQKAKAELADRYGNNRETVRDNTINPAIYNNGEQGQSNLETKVQESITKSKETRKQYLQSLTSDY